MAEGFITTQQQGGKGAFTAPSNDANEQIINKKIEEALKKYDEYQKEDRLNFIREYMGFSGFTDRKVSDTPKEAKALVNRDYVTANGVTGSRPSAPILAQFYFDTTLGYPIWYNGSDWVDAQGNTA